MLGSAFMRLCKGPCAQTKPDEAFELKSNGYRRRTCIPCRNKASFGGNTESRLAYGRAFRQKNPHRTIVIDSRSSDRKAGLEGHDLDHEYVALLVKDGCRYCGDTSLRMTLDRIDNNTAHTKANVVPCCIRCNYLRGSMPYAAWLHLVPAVREARGLGLFGDWRSRPFNLR